jgi:CheY-like chemotaxis protein
MIVLLVDDDVVCNIISRKILERMWPATEIYIALNGAEAIDLFNNYFRGEQCLPDIILLDLNMPVMGGFDFLEAFKNLKLDNKENVKIVVVSSSASPHDISRAKAMGVDHYLVKPISADKLAAALR